MNHPLIALPGGVMPAALRYAPLKSALNGEVELHVKDLEVYATDAPPPDYSVDVEVAALLRLADSVGAKRFHLIGYSGGGFVSLAFAGRYPERLLSLAVFEPARVPGEPSPEEAVLDREFRGALAGAEGPEFMRIFTSRQVRQGVDVPPPAGPPPPWMRTRPAGLAAMLRAFGSYPFDRRLLRRCDFPVLYGYGDLTSKMVELQAAVLARLLPDLQVRRFSGVHHFVPPEQLYTAEHIAALRDLWTRAERRGSIERKPMAQAGSR